MADILEKYRDQFERNAECVVHQCVASGFAQHEAEEIKGFPAPGYHASPRLSCSRLKSMAKSPAHFRYAMEYPPTSTAAMDIGSATHCLTLEGKATYQELFAGAPEGIDRRTKAGKAAWAAFLDKARGKTVLTAEQARLVEGMASAVWGSDTASKFLNARAATESSIFFSVNGVEMKARLDAYTDQGVIIDLKTTGQPVDQFPRQAFNLQYPLQAAIYSEAYRQIHGDPTGFVFIVVESTPPHGVTCFLADEAFTAYGKAEFDRLLTLYKQCIERDEWPGYPEELRILELPAWARGVDDE